MKKTDTLTDTFKMRLDAFIIGCDSLEEIEKWDIDTYVMKMEYDRNATIIRFFSG